MTGTAEEVRHVVSEAEETMAWQIKVAGLPTPQREYRFFPARRWRFDFAWPFESVRSDKARPVALEVEGGSWVNGAHNRGKHFASDIEKYNAAGMLGWLVLRVTPDMVTDGRALTLVETALR